MIPETIYLTVDPGLDMGVATIVKGRYLYGRTYSIRGKNLVEQVEKTTDALLMQCAYQRGKVSASLLYTKYQGVNISKQSIITYGGNLALIHLAMQQLFGHVELIHDDTARSVVFYGRKLNKKQAHVALGKRFDLSHLTKNKRGNPHKDTLDASIGVLAWASRNNINIQDLRKAS